MLCTATSKRSGQPCKAPAVTGRSVCRIHGGRTLMGVASGQFKTGRYSKHLPAHLVGRYTTATRDPDLLVLRDEVALTDTRLADLLDRLSQVDNAAAWSAVRHAFTTYAAALAAVKDGDDPPDALLADLRRAIYAGSDDDRVWDGISDVLEQRRKLVESERKRLVDLQQMITAEQALVLVSQIADSVQRHVSDRAAVAAISADLSRLLHTAPANPADG